MTKRTHKEETKKKMSETKKANIAAGLNSQIKAVRLFLDDEIYDEYPCMRYAGIAIHEYFEKNGISSTKRSAEEALKRILAGYKPTKGKYVRFNAEFINKER